MPSPLIALRSFGRRRPWLTAAAVVTVLVAVFIAWFDWDRVRPPLERVLSERLQRTVQADHLDVWLRWQPRIRVDGLRIGNADGFEGETMVDVGAVEFTVSLRDALAGRVSLPSVALHEADVSLERNANGAANWILASPDTAPKDETDDEPAAVRINALTIDRGRLRFKDDKARFDLLLHADTLDPEQAAAADKSDPPLRTRLRFDGHYQRARFDGEAMVGDVLSLRESGQFFPIRGKLRAGTTKLSVDGRIADVTELTGVDVRLAIEGQTLGNLYPFLLLPLPATPPYQLAGRLVLADNRYELTELDGRIGATDIQGTARYTQRDTRPLLEADLTSRQLLMSDLGPLIGVETKASAGKPAYDQNQTATRGKARAAERQANADRLLPAGRFEPEKLRAIDANVKLAAARMKLTEGLPLERFDAALNLEDGLLRLEPFRFGFAGGSIDANVQLDGRKNDLDSRLRIDVKRLQVARLVPDSPTLAQGAGSVTGRLEMHGRGNSIADAAAKADGSLAAVINGGRISNLLDAAAGLNGGKIVTLLLGGDRDINLRCGGAAFDIKKGVGRSTLFVVDTEQTQILGDGQFNLDTERFDFKVVPRPKSPGILSLRTPVHLHGAFRDPEYQLEKLPLAARLGGALALAAVAPPAALLALIETGPGESADCQQVLREARRSLSGDKPARAGAAR